MSTKKRPSGSEAEGLRPFWRPDSWREGQEARLLGRGSQDTKWRGRTSAGGSGRGRRLGRNTGNRATHRCSSRMDKVFAQQERMNVRLRKEALWELRALEAGIKWDQLTGEVL